MVLAPDGSTAVLERYDGQVSGGYSSGKVAAGQVGEVIWKPHLLVLEHNLGRYANDHIEDHGETRCDDPQPGVGRGQNRRTQAPLVAPPRATCWRCLDGRSCRAGTAPPQLGDPVPDARKGHWPLAATSAFAGGLRVKQPYAGHEAGHVRVCSKRMPVTNPSSSMSSWIEKKARGQSTTLPA